MRRSRNNILSFESLEQRRVLAGNVNVLISDAILIIVGDSADNQLQLSRNGSGVVVSGLDNTTINGNASFTVGGGFKHVTISMAAGNDEVSVSNLNVSSNFSFYGGAGNDRLTTNGLAARHFHGEGNIGDDVFEVNMNIRKSAYLYLGAGDDIVASNNLNAGRNLKIFGHAGNDTVSTEQMRVGRKLEFFLGDGNDDVLMSGETSVRNSARIDLGSGNDFLGIQPSANNGTATFRQSLNVEGRDGNDNIAFDSRVNVRGALRTDGGEGTDALQFRDANLDRLKQGAFEGFQVGNLTNLIDQVFTRLEDAGIGIPPVDVPLNATSSTSTLNFGENSNAVSVDSAFSLTGSGNVTGATIQIDGFLAGQDTLTFANANGISGSFNSTTGLMTLSGVATVANYQQAIRSVQYQNTSDNPGTDERNLQFVITSDDETVNASRTLQVTAVNDAPIVTPQNANQTILPTDLPVLIDNQMTVTDPDSTTLASATVRITSGFVPSQDRLTSQDSNGILSNYDVTSGTLTMTGVASVANWQTALRTIRYDNVGTTPSEGTRVIQLTLNDGSSTDVTEFQINLQQEAQPNTFSVTESTANGTVLGTIETAGTFQTPTLYQFVDSQAPQELLLNVDDHISGDLTASVVLIEYLDFQCPGCATYHPIVNQLESDFDGDLLVVRRHLPLESVHQNARAAAIVVEAADRQGLFNEVADQLFENQNEWEFVADPTALFEGYAAAAGVNIDQLRVDIADSAVDARITRDATEAAGLGINSTPAFVLQNEPLANPDPSSQDAFETVIRDAVDTLTDPFTINRQTGEIILRDAALLDAAGTPTVTMSVLVVDADGNEETVEVTINVSN